MERVRNIDPSLKAVLLPLVLAMLLAIPTPARAQVSYEVPKGGRAIADSTIVTSPVSSKFSVNK